MSAVEAVALLVAVAIAAVHLLAPRLWAAAERPRSPVLSCAGGVSVAFVFVHLLPELSRAQDEVGDAVGLLPYLERHVYLLALLGLVVFYGLEGLSRPDAGGVAGGGIAAAASFAVFGAYNAVIGYLLVEQAGDGALRVALFGLAMGLHLLVIDEALREQHRDAHARAGRYLLAAGVLLGWSTGLLTEVAPATLGLAIAFLAGGIVLNVLKQELPAERQSRFGFFALGVGAYSALLLVV